MDALRNVACHMSVPCLSTKKNNYQKGLFLEFYSNLESRYEQRLSTNEILLCELQITLLFWCIQILVHPMQDVETEQKDFKTHNAKEKPFHKKSKENSKSLILWHV